MEMIRIAVGLLLASAAVLAQQPKQGSGNTNPLGHSEQVVEEGRKLFNDNCTVCHGMAGTEGERGPALAAGSKHTRQSDQETRPRASRSSGEKASAVSAT